MTLSWDELEALVLRWVFEHTGEDSGVLPHHSAEPFDGIPSLTQSQVVKAIDRLIEHGLVAPRSGPGVTIGYRAWMGLRPTANGLRVLGHWPPGDGASVNAALAGVLRQLASADAVPKDHRSAARRAAATVTNLSGDVVLDVMKDELAPSPGGAS